MTLLNLSCLPLDPRTDGWLMMSSPLPTFSICVSYVVLVKLIGPWFMRHRPPFQFRLLLIAYNFAQMIFSAWLFKNVSSFNEWITACQNKN